MRTVSSTPPLAVGGWIARHPRWGAWTASLTPQITSRSPGPYAAARGHLVVFEAIAVAGNLEAHAVPEVIAVRFRPDRVQIVAAFVDEQQQAFPARQP